MSQDFPRHKGRQRLRIPWPNGFRFGALGQHSGSGLGFQLLPRRLSPELSPGCPVPPLTLMACICPRRCTDGFRSLARILGGGSGGSTLKLGLRLRACGKFRRRAERPWPSLTGLAQKPDHAACMNDRIAALSPTVSLSQ